MGGYVMHISFAFAKGVSGAIYFNPAFIFSAVL